MSLISVQKGGILLAQAIGLVACRLHSQPKRPRSLESAACHMTSKMQPASMCTPMLDRLMALPPDTLNVVFAMILERTSHVNDALPKGTLTRWHAKVPSPIDIKVYLNRSVRAHSLLVITRGPREIDRNAGARSSYL